ncbi:hypothetical protein [Paenibacillus sp. OK060]|uniref:hypothetical protein n=1 Tax=Paenibacillus sp. OK060 TaxID=1881034 RepID=UPI0015A0B713|nr:hypothetical protein [Paenibacillus sp. OK060]
MPAVWPPKECPAAAIRLRSVRPLCFVEELSPALKTLIETATAADEVRAKITPDELLWAVASLCTGVDNGDIAHAKNIVSLLVDGLRYRAKR